MAVSTHLKKIRQIGHVPQIQGEHKKYVKPPPREELETTYGALEIVFYNKFWIGKLMILVLGREVSNLDDGKFTRSKLPLGYGFSVTLPKLPGGGHFLFHPSSVQPEKNRKVLKNCWSSGDFSPFFLGWGGGGDKSKQSQHEHL